MPTIKTKTNLPKQKPGSDPGFLFCQAASNCATDCNRFAEEGGLEGDDGKPHRGWMRFLLPKKAPQKPAEASACGDRSFSWCIISEIGDRAADWAQAQPADFLSRRAAQQL